MVLDAANVCNLKINDYLGKEFECKCGKKHRIDINKIVIGKGALLQIPAILREFKCKKIFMVADTNTYQAVGQNVERLIKDSAFLFKSLVYVREGDLVPDETAIGEFFVNVDNDTDMIVAVGSGVINDLTKYVSTRLGIPFIIVASAPSMDGFTSNGAALILDNLKTSPAVEPAKAIIGDVDVLKNAPMEMITAGLGDMLGKYSSLKDWKISHILFGEYYCEAVTEMVRCSVQKCIDNIQGIKNRDEFAIQSLMEGLVVSGIAMSFAGNSRPASGSEHHISHYWEMMFLQQGKKAVLHGTKVGIAALAINHIGNLLASRQIDFAQAVRNSGNFDAQKWEVEVNRLFQKAAPGIIKQCAQANNNSVTGRAERLKSIKAKWDQIVAVLREGPSAEELQQILETVGAHINPKEVGVDSETVYYSIIYAKEIRMRYTVLQLLWDLGLIEEFAQEIKTYYARAEQ